MFKIPYRFILIALIFSMALPAMPPPAVEAQDGSGSQLQFTGTVDDIDDTFVTVSGLTVDTSLVTISGADLEVGMTVTVIGVYDGTVVVAAVVIVVTDAPPSDVPPADDSGDDEGDSTSDEGSDDQGEDEDEDDNTENGPIIVIEGPVQSITVNVITIFNIDVQVEPDDPILEDLQIGDYVRIAGYTDFGSSTIIIVAVTVVIVNINIIVDGGGLPANCKRTAKGKITCKRTER